MHKQNSRQVLLNLGGLVKKHNINQAQLAEILGVRQGTISDLLRGKFNPTLDIVFKYLAAINKLSGENYTLKDIDIVSLI